MGNKKQLEKTYSTEIENTYKEFQTKAQTYSADAANQTDVTNQARQKELETMQQNINQYRETAAQDLQKKCCLSIKSVTSRCYFVTVGCIQV